MHAFGECRSPPLEARAYGRLQPGNPQLGDRHHLAFMRHDVHTKTEAQSGRHPPSPDTPNAARITRAHKLRQQPVEAPAAWIGRGLFLWRERGGGRAPLGLGGVRVIAEAPMWTLILVTFLASGASIGGVGTTTSFLDFPNEAKCRAAAETLTGIGQVTPSHGGHLNISPSATYRIVAFCVER